jgi:hypothetical protein
MTVILMETPIRRQLAIPARVYVAAEIQLRFLSMGIFEP